MLTKLVKCACPIEDGGSIALAAVMAPLIDSIFQ
jgi:hypothetical protein